MTPEESARKTHDEVKMFLPEDDTLEVSLTGAEVIAVALGLRKVIDTETETVADSAKSVGRKLSNAIRIQKTGKEPLF